MLFVNYFLASLISFSGLFIGLFLMRIAPEEKKQLEKYLLWLRLAAVFLVFAFMLFYYYDKKFNMLVLLGYLLFLILLEYFTKDIFRKSVVGYAVMGIIFYLGSFNQNLIFIVSFLILVYGIATASLLHRRNDNARIVIFYSSFLILANALFLMARLMLV